MTKRNLVLTAIIIWMGFSAYWYICKIKGQCQQPTGSEVEVVTEAENKFSNAHAIYFLPSSVNYTAGAEVDQYLKDVAGFVKENSDKKVRLVGYSANLGRTAGYQQMSLARANVIKQKLVGMGVETEKIMVEAKGIEGQSATASEEEKAKSRRVEVYVQ